jgi:hypothetical protein
MPVDDRLAVPYCASCHTQIDPIGRGFERYDAIGRFSSTSPSSVTGTLAGAGEADGTFDGPTELAERLVRSESARDCFVRQWFRFGMSREATEADEETLASANTVFVSAGLDFRELVVALVRSNAFTVRRDVPTSSDCAAATEEDR